MAHQRKTWKLKMEGDIVCPHKQAQKYTHTYTHIHTHTHTHTQPWLLVHSSLSESKRRRFIHHPNPMIGPVSSWWCYEILKREGGRQYKPSLLLPILIEVILPRSRWDSSRPPQHIHSLIHADEFSYRMPTYSISHVSYIWVVSLIYEACLLYMGHSLIVCPRTHVRLHHYTLVPTF